MSLIVENLSLSFDAPVFSNVSFTLQKGEIACLLGRSGCGKTSLLRCILGFNRPHSGSVTMDSVRLFDDKTNIEPHKRQVGMVFQDYGLFPHLTVAQNIAFGLVKPPQSRIDELLSLVALTDFAKRYPHELSGGQQQRVALARAIAPKPNFILLDEPFSNLDVELKQTLSDEIRDLLKSQNIGAILVTHDQSEAFAIADKIGVMSEGHLCQWDTPMGLYHTPSKLAVASFIGDGTIVAIDGWQDGQAQTCLGLLPCRNADDNSNKKHLLIRPCGVSLTADKQATWTIHNKKFRDGRWLYELKASTQTDSHLALKAFDQQDLALGEKVAVDVHRSWAF